MFRLQNVWSGLVTNFSAKPWILKSTWEYGELRMPYKTILLWFYVTYFLFSGELRPLEVTVAQQTQFTPLPEALCVIVAELNRRSIPATVDSVLKELSQLYRDVQAPPERMVYEVLDVLISERKLLHTGKIFMMKISGGCVPRVQSVVRLFFE